MSRSHLSFVMGGDWILLLFLWQLLLLFQSIEFFFSVDAMRLSYYSLILLDAEIVWCQEEPMNMGAYSYILPRLFTAVKSVGRGTIEDIKYAGRAPSAASATGFFQVHVKEQTELVQKALQREPIDYTF